MVFDPNGQVYDIEEIVDHKKGKNGKTFYYVKWKVRFHLFLMDLSINHLLKWNLIFYGDDCLSFYTKSRVMIRTKILGSLKKILHR